MNDPRPFSQACENNKGPILEVLRDILDRPGTILEIGTGTGQHAVHFARHLPHLVWQPSDIPGSETTCLPWLNEYGLANILSPLPLDVAGERWPVSRADGVFSANTAHIMAWPEVRAMFFGITTITRVGDPFFLYGPFKYGDRHTSESNRRFDEGLRAQPGRMGIRDMDALAPLASEAGLELEEDREMPANNRLVVWRRT